MRSLSYSDCDRFLSIHGTVHELVMDMIAENAAGSPWSAVLLHECKGNSIVQLNNDLLVR